MNKEEILNKYAEKIGQPLEVIQKDFQELVDEETTIHPEATEDDKNNKALRRLGLSYKKQLRSPAKWFEGMVIAISDTFDMVRKMRAEAIKEFNENPQNAVTSGITDEEGIPLDPRATWSTGRENPGFGKPLPEHKYICNIIGIATKDDGKPKIFRMAIQDSLAENSDKIPMFAPVKFRANDRSEAEDEEFSLNVSTVTVFVEDQTISMPTPTEVIKKFCTNYAVDMNALQDHHSANKDDFNRLAIIEADVSALVMEPTATGSRRMIVEDANASIEDLDATGITCWVPSKINIDFGETSRVFVVGRTAQGKKYVDGQATDEDGDIMMNVFGVYAIPEYKVAPEVEIQPLAPETTPEPEAESVPAAEVAPAVPTPAPNAPADSQENNPAPSSW